VAVVVTRYFGGTKLGTGGLVRAYGDAVREVLSILPRAQRVPTCTILLDMPYNAYEHLCLLVEAHGGQIQDQDFGAEVTVQARFPQDRYAAFETALQEASNGRLEALIVEQGEAIVPVDKLEPQ
jgi:putative IMPACT (imprinted ancient) family translation regulator